ncbi:conserved hypothetical protein [Candidatus Zixiibacteriota bacterium]|nr:conserved hypothetical protein [candidate division Zixibacteria bacterium]
MAALGAQDPNRILQSRLVILKLAPVIMRKFEKPTVVVSHCLGFEAVRYNGAIINDDFVERLKGYVKFVTVCPEVEIGLGVPREPVRIVEIKGRRRLIQPATGLDLTEKMERFSEKFLKSLPEVDGFIMKSRSPSSGIKDVKIYSGKEKSPAIGKGPGFFGGEILEMFPGTAIEDEGRLLNLRIREHFLTRIFALAALRKVVGSGTIGKLVAFHTANKLLLMSASQKEMRLLGKIVANHEKRKFIDVGNDYDIHFRAALARPIRESANVNMLMHAFGYFSDKLSSNEKKHFLDLLEKYRNRRLPLAALTGIMHSWIIRFDEPYLAGQTFFELYPEELTELHDSGKGRDI